MKGLAETAWVVPLQPHLGMWRSLAGGWVRGRAGGASAGDGLGTPLNLQPGSCIPWPASANCIRSPSNWKHCSIGCSPPLAVLKEKDLLKVPAEAMPLEQCALLREHLTAYRLLEDHAALKVGAGWRVGAGVGKWAL